MNDTQLKLLQINLPEIYMGLTSEEATPNHLPFSTFKREMYCHQSCFGKFLKIFSQSKNKTRDQDKVNSALTYTLNEAFDSTVRRIHQLYHCYVIHYINLLRASQTDIKQDSELVKHHYKIYVLSCLGICQSDEKENLTLTPYLEYANHYLLKEPLSNREAETIKKMITKCSQTTFPIWKLENRKEKRKKDEQILMLLDRFAPQDRLSSAFFNPYLYQSFYQAQSLIDIEGIVGQAIPLVILAKLCHVKLTDTEKWELGSWIKQINAKRKEIKFKDFEQALIEIVHIINIEGHYPIQLEELEIQLEKLNCQFFQEDEDHLQWRRGLKSGDKIYCNNQELTLGELLSPKKGIDDHYQIFALADEERSGQVVKIGKNRTELKIEKIKFERERQFLQQVEEGDWHVKILEIDLEGTCMILEKLTAPFLHYQWKSNSSQLHKEDEMIAYKIAKRFHRMWEKKMTPKNLQPETLMFDSEGNLKSLQLWQMETFNYNTLEQFCQTIENSYVRNYILQRSQLIHHPIAANFYRPAVQAAIKSGADIRVTLVIPKGYENQIYEKHLKQLVENTLELRENCFSEVKFKLQEIKKHDHENDDSLKSKVYQKLLDEYENSMTAGILQPELKKEVVNSFINGEVVQSMSKKVTFVVANLLVGASDLLKH